MAYYLSWAALPAEITGLFVADPLRVVKNWHMFFCVASGLWGGLAIGIVTEYYTSNRYEPVKVGELPYLLGRTGNDFQIDSAITIHSVC